MLPGNYVIEFSDVVDWLTPSNQYITLNSGDSVTVTGVYVTSTGAPKIHYFSAYPEVIGEQDETLLSWKVVNANSISIDNGVGGVGALSTRKVTPGTTTTYTITASNAYGTSEAVVTVTVKEQPEILWFDSSKSSIGKDGSVELSWGATTATKVTLSSKKMVGPSARTNVNIETGMLELTPKKSTTYTLTATNEVGEVTSNLDVDVSNAPEIAKFYSLPEAIAEGDEATIYWDITGADYAEISEIGEVKATSGKRKVSPEKTLSYSLTASNGSGDADSQITLKVYPVDECVDLSITATPDVASNTNIAGNQLTYFFTLENNGQNKAKNFMVSLKSDKGEGDSVFVGRLNAGSSKQIRMNYLPFKGGLHKLHVMVDEIGLNADLDRTNNSLQFTERFTAATNADLLVSNINLTRATDKFAVIDFELRNIGSLESSGFQWQVFVQEKAEDKKLLLSTGHLEELAAGKYEQLSKVLDLSQFDSRVIITVVIDAYDAIEESNLTNNSKSTSYNLSRLK